MTTVICPHCKKPVEVSRALELQVEEQVSSRLHEQHIKELEEAKQKALGDAARKIKRQFELQLKQAQEDAAANEERNRQLLEQITEMTKSMRQLKTEKEEAKLQMQRKLALEEEKIRLVASRKAEEEQRSKIMEKEKQLQDALKANEEMRRKLQQGSQQAQGEVFELEFEGMLKSQYPNDKVMPVGKGIRGADLVQEVWDRNGNCAGKILWELKNTKSWSDAWIEKLKNDKRLINAEEAVVISEVVPNTIKTAGFRDGIWVTQRSCVILIADMLRAKLIQLYYVKNSVQAKDEKMEILYEYLSGTQFKHRVEAIVEAFTNMQAEVEKEKRYFANKWARDEKNIRQVIDNTYGMHGDLKGIIGKMLPQIKGLEMLEPGSGEATHHTVHGEEQLTMVEEKDEISIRQTNN